MLDGENRPDRASEKVAAASARRAAYEGKGIQPRAAQRGSEGIALGTTRRAAAFPSKMRAEKKLHERDGKQLYKVEGYATMFDRSYDMWDMFGPYTETVRSGAADTTLKSNPDVVFLLNHKGLSMARTTNGSLELRADETGLHDIAWLNPERQDVKDLMEAIHDEVVTEQSFAFMITEGYWNQDFTEFEIAEFDINRGDVSAVNYGANPHTEIAARQQEFMTEVDMLPASVARALFERLTHRTDILAREIDTMRRIEEERALRREPARVGRSLKHVANELGEDLDHLSF